MTTTVAPHVFYEAGFARGKEFFENNDRVFLDLRLCAEIDAKWLISIDQLPIEQTLSFIDGWLDGYAWTFEQLRGHVTGDDYRRLYDK